MTATSLLTVQTAIVSALKNNAPFLASVEYIGEEPAETTEYPFVIIGESTMQRFDTFNRSGNRNTITIHIWSDFKGYEECYTILNAMNQILDYEPLTIAGNNLVYLRLDSVLTIKDIYRHLVARYLYVTQPT